jgi:hypothetical protein
MISSKIGDYTELQPRCVVLHILGNLVFQASLDAVNERLPSPLPMNRFRPKYVLSDLPGSVNLIRELLPLLDLLQKVLNPYRNLFENTILELTGRSNSNKYFLIA